MLHAAPLSSLRKVAKPNLNSKLSIFNPLSSRLPASQPLTHYSQSPVSPPRLSSPLPLHSPVSTLLYLGGDIFTLADLHHLPNISGAMRTQVKKLFDSRPHVSAWVADITSRTAWSKVVAVNNLSTGSRSTQSVTRCLSVSP
ncbi:hypothetical protein NC652_010335 [Populus alba x Populus x berolinensis]|nr:hypothetical protein NC652_010335 [Populus alba x Populus x berolinensis]